MKVVGLDLSLTGTGLASSNGRCELYGRKGITTLPLKERVRWIRSLREEIVIWTTFEMPDLVAVELPAFSRAGGGAIERHALYWEVVTRLLAKDIPVAEVPATCRAKYATGKGNGQKNAVVDAVARRLPMFATGGNDNLCDAAILAAMGADHLGEPIAAFPQSHRDALKTVAWPVLIGD